MVSLIMRLTFVLLMDKIISYDKRTMTLKIHIGKYYKYLQCPFATWWKARKYFKRPRFRFYFGRMQKKEWYSGSDVYTIKPQYIYMDKGFRYFLSGDYIRWKTSELFPILMESRDICWKDKYNTPRYEHPGFFSIIFGRDLRYAWQFVMAVDAPDIYFLNNGKTKDKIYSDVYWESMLWYNNYYKEYESDKPDLKKAFISETGYSSTSNRHTLNGFNFCEVTYKDKPCIDFFKTINPYDELFINGISNLDRVCVKAEDKDAWVYGLNCYIDTDNGDYILHCIFSLSDLQRLNINCDNVDICLYKHISLYKTFNELLLTDKGIKELENG